MMMLNNLNSFAAIAAILLVSCSQTKDSDRTNNYLKDTTPGIKTGGTKLIQINTTKGKFKVWTKRIGNNPKIKVLLLSGGPGSSHEYFECMESFLPAEGIEFIYYDQLGTGHSDDPKDAELWNIQRFVEEVEQVRQALKLDKNNFYLFGHSWGGALAAQYALKYQQHLKGLIIGNMMMSMVGYGRYADEVLAKQLDPKVLARIREMEASKDFENPEYMELLLPNFYAKHIIRMKVEEWPEPITRSFGKMNQLMYLTMQGPSEFGTSGNLATWDITRELPKITVPTLAIGAKHDTMDPKHMEWIATQVKYGSFLYCARGSHMSMYDDQETYMRGLIKFIKAIDAGSNTVQFHQ